MPKSNCSVHAKYRVTLASSDDSLTAGPTYQSAWLPVYPAWLSANDAYGWPMPIVHFVDDALDGVDALFGMIEWDDQSNANGALEINRALFTGVYVFPRSMSVGAAPMIPVDDSEVWKSDGNTRVFNDIPPMRTASFEINRVKEADAYGAMAEMERRLGASGQVYYCFGQHDPLKHIRSFLATRKPKGATWKWSTELGNCC